MRATSTVLDAALFLFLVSAAVVALSVPAEPPVENGVADSTAAVLSGTTRNVDYTLSPLSGDDRASSVRFDRTRGPEFRRRDHGTLAALLARATIGNVAVDGRRVTHTWDGYGRAVANVTRNVTRGRTELVQVRAVWAPYPGAPVGGRISVGPSPTPDADVHAATVTVDSDMPAVRDRALEVAGDGGFEAVGRVVADGVVAGLFPPRTTRLALGADHPVDVLLRHRYYRFASLTGADVDRPLDRRNVTGANERLSEALASRLATDLRRRFETPRAAARAVSVGRVRITVRTWSP